MAKFDAMRFFRSRGLDPRTTLTIPHPEGNFRLRLEGMASAVTAAAMAELAEEQTGPVTITQRSTTKLGGKPVVFSNSFTQEDTAEFITENLSASAEESGEPNEKTKRQTAGANGSK